MDKGIIELNRPEDKKVDDYDYYIREMTVTGKEGERGYAGAEDCIDAAIHELEEYIKKSKERLITIKGLVI